MAQKLNTSIFDPFKNCKGKQVIIVTWNLVPLTQLPAELIRQLQEAHSVSIYVGFSKTSHNLPLLLSIMREYSWQGFDVFALANCHVKIWTIGNKLWVGSANFCAPSLLNIMIQTERKEAWTMLRTITDRAVELSASTNLKLVPQVQLESDLGPCIF